MKTNSEMFQTVPGAIAEIYRRAEQRLANALKPGALAPLYNYSHGNCRAASDSVITRVRRELSSSVTR